MTAGRLPSKQPLAAELLEEINQYIDTVTEPVFAVNAKIHENPETAWEEHVAHDAICMMLENLGFDVRRQAYGIATAFEVQTGESGPVVNFNAEYDALPDIGHACGHNLIASAALIAFLASSYILKKYHLPGRLVCLGTPAEELGGGKITLLNAGAYKNVTASLMAHPCAEHDIPDGAEFIGTAGMKSLAIGELHATFHGKSAHAARYPWEGVNALDAIVSSYCNVSMLRQQLRPAERIHGCIEQAPKISNAIPYLTRVSYAYRSPTMEGLEALEKKVKACMEAGAHGTGCSVELSTVPAYADLVINDALCSNFQGHMARLGHTVSQKWEDPGAGSTDQGNVSQVIPALHAVVAIPCPKGTHTHHQSFAEAAGTVEAFERFVDTGKAMALVALDLVTDETLRQCIEKEFGRQSTS